MKNQNPKSFVTLSRAKSLAKRSPRRCVGARFLAMLGMTLTVIGLSLLTGCSRTVTQMPVFGNELNVEITLAANANVSDNRYFIIFSTMESYQIPLPPPDSLDEFLEPGDDPQPGTTTKADYYNLYYSTWAGYVVIDSQGYSVVKGPFNIATPTTRDLISGLGNISNNLSFNLSLSRIFGTTLPQRIYFDIITVSYPPGSAKSLADRISPPVNSFEPIRGTIVSNTDADTITTSIPSLNITSWKVSIP